MNLVRRLAVVVVALGNVTVVQADLIEYRIDAHIDSCTVGQERRDCDIYDAVSADNTYSGYFKFDASVLENDGYKDAQFDSFYFELGATVWDSNNPSDFAGSRYYNPETRLGGFSDDEFTFLVEGGELTGLCCGVHGRGDFPYLDLWSFGPGSSLNNFVNINAYLTRSDPNPGGISFYAQGQFSIHQVPEPGTLALFGIGLAGMGLVRRKKVEPR